MIKLMNGYLRGVFVFLTTFRAAVSGLPGSVSDILRDNIPKVSTGSGVKITLPINRQSIGNGKNKTQSLISLTSFIRMSCPTP